MVSAILDGRKTQTRRVAKVLLPGGKNFIHAASTKEWRAKRAGQCPYGKPGDRLWVRETWKCAWTFEHGHGIRYKVGDQFRCFNGCCHKLIVQQPGYDWIVKNYGCDWRTEPWRPSIFMPRWASRLTLEITGIRVERVGCQNKWQARRC